MARTVGGKVRAEIELLDGEEVVWSKSASRHGETIATGGKLFLTERRLLWAPNWYFGSLGVGTVELPLTEVAAVDVDTGEFKGILRTLVTGGSSNRLRVEDEDGDVETWSISTPEEASEQIRAAMVDD